MFYARNVQSAVGETKPFHTRARITHSILQTRKWSTKKKKVICPRTGIQTQKEIFKILFLFYIIIYIIFYFYIIIILFVFFHKGLFYQLDPHIVSAARKPRFQGDGRCKNEDGG